MRYNPYTRRRRLNSAVAPVRRYDTEAVANPTDPDYEKLIDYLDYLDDWQIDAVVQACEANDITWDDAYETTWHVYKNCTSNVEFARRYFEEFGYQDFLDDKRAKMSEGLVACFDFSKVAQLMDNYIATYQVPGTDIMVGWVYETLWFDPYKL